jgi:hypothetical protein
LQKIIEAELIIEVDDDLELSPDFESIPIGHFLLEHDTDFIKDINITKKLPSE